MEGFKELIYEIHRYLVDGSKDSKSDAIVDKISDVLLGGVKFKVVTLDSKIVEELSIADLSLVPAPGGRGQVLNVTINNKEYGYVPSSNTMNVAQLLVKVQKIAKFSSGRALQWLKNNSILVYGGKSTPPSFRSGTF